jgi:uncharacterized membrane protein YidH (DUF202 family)
MGWSRISLRAMIIAVAIIGFDSAVMIRAIQRGRAVHSLRDYAIGFGVILLVLNLDVLALLLYYARRADTTKSSRLRSTPPPLVIMGTYLAVLAIAILSVLFLSSGLL